jgi:lipoprotein-releasing system permease protein
VTFEKHLAVRYLRSRRRYGFVSVIPLLSCLGIAVGVMAMLVTLSVMDGFEEDLKEKLLGNMAPITLMRKHMSQDHVQELRETLAGVGEVRGLSPYVRTQVLLLSSGRPVGATLMGIEPESIPLVSRLPGQLLEGSLDALREPIKSGQAFPSECEGRPAILLGRELTNNLGCFYGDPIRVVSPVGIETPFGVMPIQETFCVGGVFQTGLYEYDATFAYVALGEAQSFLRIGREISGIEVGISRVERARERAEEIKGLLGDAYRVEDWMQKNRRLLSAMRLEKITAFAVLALIVLVAVLNILSSLAMTVIEKKKEIAILKALGATRGRIQGLFVLQGMLIGLSGTGVGVLAGVGACKILARYPVVTLPQDVFYQLTLPVRMELVDILSVAVAALLLSLLATLYPAWKAARLLPAETFRYE